jgi:hypothetical protein
MWVEADKTTYTKQGQNFTWFSGFNVVLKVSVIPFNIACDK